MLGQIRLRVDKKERCLVTTLTKRMAEELTDYLSEMDVKVHYLHSEIDTLRDKYSDENDEEKLKFLDELNKHIMSIQQKYENA